jgi:hypothetical protein
MASETAARLQAKAWPLLALVGIAALAWALRLRLDPATSPSEARGMLFLALSLFLSCGPSPSPKFRNRWYALFAGAVTLALTYSVFVSG